MADLKISGLIAAAPPQMADQFAIERGSASNKRVSLTQLQELILGADTRNFFNGATLLGVTIAVTSNGTTVTLSVSDAADATVIFSTGVYSWNINPVSDDVTLTSGSDISPTLNYVYLLESTKALTVSTSGFPTAEHAPVATVVVQSAIGVQSDGAYKVHQWVDHVSTVGEIGHLLDISDWIRTQPATYLSGVSQTLTITPGSPDTVIFTTASGMVQQLHSHAFPAFSGTPDIYVINDPITAYDVVTDLASLLTDALGASMSGRRFSLVIWGVVSEDGADCKLFCNLPGGSYNSDAAVIADSSKYANFSIPSEYVGTGFLISELKLRHQTSGGGTWTSISEVDLRGLFPTKSAGAASATGSEFVDNAFRIVRDVDDTKVMAFNVGSNLPTGVIVVVHAPPSDLKLGVATFVNVTGTSEPLFAVYANIQLSLENVSPISLNVDVNAAHPFALGEEIIIEQKGAGQVTVTSLPGVTIESLGGATKTAGQYARARLTYRGSEVWLLSGDITT